MYIVGNNNDMFKVKTFYGGHGIKPNTVGCCCPTATNADKLTNITNILLREFLATAWKQIF